jgi:hypothetical protein
MANTYTLIAKYQATSGSLASIDFTSIPQTFTDLLVKIPARSSLNDSSFNIFFNGSASTITGISMDTYYASPITGLVGRALTSNWIGTNAITDVGRGANIFAGIELYVGEYSNTSVNKKGWWTANQENNAAQAAATIGWFTYGSNTAISEINLRLPATGVFIQYSTAYLYGIKKS